MLTKPTGQIAARMRACMPKSRLTPRSLQTTTTLTVQRAQTRLVSSTQPSSFRETKPQGSLNMKTFYKTFGRPIAKVFLIAFFTYQLAYYVWVWLELKELRAEMQAIISNLEARIQNLEDARTKKVDVIVNIEHE